MRKMQSDDWVYSLTPSRLRNRQSTASIRTPKKEWARLAQVAFGDDDAGSRLAINGHLPSLDWGPSALPVGMAKLHVVSGISARRFE
jgi:hypothetical protein